MARLPRAPPRREGGRLLHRLSFLPHGHLQGALRSRRARRLLPRPAATRAGRPVRHLPPALLDEHDADPGSARSRSASCATTARSTRSRGTSTGCGRARATSAPPTTSSTTPSWIESGSDSAMLDNALEFVVHGGRDVRHALSMLMPPAWEGNRELPQEVRDFYRYHSGLVEPWDGPAGLVFTDGHVVGAALDRNGLRPLRYAVCEDGFVACSSEAGAVSLDGHGIVQARQARPRADDRRGSRAGASRRTTRSSAPRRRAALRRLARGGHRGRVRRSRRSSRPRKTSRRARRFTATRARSSCSSCARSPRTRTTRPTRWATTRRSRRWRAAPGRSTTTSSSVSPR